MTLSVSISLALGALLGLSGCGSGDDDDAGVTAGFDGERAFAELERQVAFGPRPSGSPAAARTARWIAGRLERAGVADVRIQAPWENVLGTLPGAGPGVVVVGAHYDTKQGIRGFVGANDGASGVAVVLELARTLPRPLPGPSVQFVLFDAEEARGNRPFTEDGARGSSQYVRLAAAGGAQGAAPLEEIAAMVLFDMVGDCDLAIPLEAGSNPDLYSVFAAAATAADGSAEPFTGKRVAGVLDDHTPFAEAGVPALDIIDYTYGPGGSPGSFWHTPQDTADKVCPASLEAVGEPALAAIARLG